MILGKDYAAKTKINQDIVGRYRGRDVFIIGAGPSLEGFDFSLLEGKPKIAINLAAAFCRPSEMIAMDQAALVQIKNFGGGFGSLPQECELWFGPSIVTHGYDLADRRVRRFFVSNEEVSGSPSHLYAQYHTGLVAINLAILFGAGNIYLLGFDFKKSEKGIQHFYDKKVKQAAPMNDGGYVRTAQYYNAYKGYSNIFNLNPDSALNVFKKLSPESVFGSVKKGVQQNGNVDTGK